MKFNFSGASGATCSILNYEDRAAVLLENMVCLQSWEAVGLLLMKDHDVQIRDNVSDTYIWNEIILGCLADWATLHML